MKSAIGTGMTREDHWNVSYCVGGGDVTFSAAISTTHLLFFLPCEKHSPMYEPLDLHKKYEYSTNILPLTHISLF